MCFFWGEGRVDKVIFQGFFFFFNLNLLFQDTIYLEVYIFDHSGAGQLPVGGTWSLHILFLNLCDLSANPRIAWRRKTLSQKLRA